MQSTVPVRSLSLQLEVRLAGLGGAGLLAREQIDRLDGGAGSQVRDGAAALDRLRAGWRVGRQLAVIRVEGPPRSS